MRAAARVVLSVVMAVKSAGMTAPMTADLWVERKDTKKVGQRVDSKDDLSAGCLVVKSAELSVNKLEMTRVVSSAMMMVE